MQQTEKEFLDAYDIHDFDVPLVSVDMAIFAVEKNDLQLLLVKRDQHPEQGKWSLPGGFIDQQVDKTIDATAYRKLQEKTGIESPYLEQVETIGSEQRDPRGWSVTCLYYALIDKEKVMIGGAKESRWFSLKLLADKNLAFDHGLLVKKATQRLRAKSRYTALPIELLPEKFTLSELQKIFEIILGRDLPVKSFRRRVQSAGVIEATGESKVSGKRTAQLFKSTGLDRNYYFPRPLEE